MNLIPNVNDPGNNQVEEPSRLKRFAGKFVEVASTTTSTVSSWGSAVSTNVSQALFGRVIEHPEQGSDDSPFESCQFIAHTLVKTTSKTQQEKLESHIWDQLSTHVLRQGAHQSPITPLATLQLYLDLTAFQVEELSETEQAELNDILKDFDLNAVIRDVAHLLKYGNAQEQEQARALLSTLPPTAMNTSVIKDLIASATENDNLFKDR